MSKPRRALVSVTNKDGIVEFVRGLISRGFEIVSTGGTAKTLRDAGIPVLDASELTGFAEMLDGRVKTLHPAIHSGLLADMRKEDHAAQMTERGFQPFAVVCVNLYAFEKTVTGPHTLEEAVESIDIGGPAMVRASAKNFANVAIVVDPSDYGAVLEALDADSLAEIRPRLSAKAFRHTAFYDSMISRYLSEAVGETESETESFGFRRVATLRYGENSHQPGALYADPLHPGGVVSGRQLWGKELSYNNLLDGDAAWELVCDLPSGSCAIIKHGNPCGVSIGGNFADSYRIAKEADPISAFGGIAAFNGQIDNDAANAMTEKGNFLEVVIGTGFTDEALRIFQDRSGWGQEVRLLEVELSESKAFQTLRAIRGGVLLQKSDEEPGENWTIPTDLKPSEEEMNALRLAWSIVPHVKSNAIVITDSTKLLGVGAGQMNRVQSVRLALEQAGDAPGRVLASDAFFPFSDSVETAAAAGVKAIIQPGGSKKDNEVVTKANELGVSMVFTGVRHFRH